ncbi:hypothetical protein ACL9RL_06460 [Plantibacter sp. Mn2098]|uniref:hypothetical protein n=1 Tax=Plantibacter sp. Mn2098 TaxID=3395266 RepID=UPI003BE73AD0
MHRSTLKVPGFDIVELSPHEWRVADATENPSDATYVLAYIEQRDGAYDVLSVSPGPPHTWRATTFPEALSFARRPGAA